MGDIPDASAQGPIPAENISGIGVAGPPAEPPEEEVTESAPEETSAIKRETTEYSEEHQNALRRTPLDRILVETDSPVIFKPQSGKYTSEPKDIFRALKAVAKLKDIEEGEVARQTYLNAKTFFNLDLS